MTKKHRDFMMGFKGRTLTNRMANQSDTSCEIRSFSVTNLEMIFCL